MERFLVVAGLPRTGTTFLYHHLSQHPEINSSVRKETYLFSDGEASGRLKQLYHQPGGMKLDITPTYFFNPEQTIKNIKSLTSEAYVVIGFREIFEFVFSWFNWLKKNQILPDDLRDDQFLNGVSLQLGPSKMELNLLEPWVQYYLDPWLRAFEGRVLLFDFAILEKQSLSLLREIEAMCGLSPYFDESKISNIKYNHLHSHNFGFYEKLYNVKAIRRVVDKVFSPSMIKNIRLLLDKMASNRDVGPKERTECSLNISKEHEEILKVYNSEIKNLFQSEMFIKL